MRRICERSEGVEIIEANACEDHIHMLIAIPPKMSEIYMDIEGKE